MENDKTYRGKSLRDVMETVPDGMTVNISSRSNFVFVGTRDEWETDEKALNCWYEWITAARHRSKKPLPPFTPFSERKVLDVRPKIHKRDGIIIRVTGKESGRCWFRSEYVKEIARIRNLA